MTTTLPPLVSADWLASELGAPDLLILDATLFLPAHARDARAEYEAAHIPGAVHMDLKRFQPLPEQEPLRAMLAELGAGEGVRAVVYDDSPLRSAARGWWLLRHAGFEAAVLDGGLAKWTSEGRQVDPPRDGEGDHRPQADGGGGASPARHLTNEHSIGVGAPSTTGLRPAVPLPVPGRISKHDLLTTNAQIVDARSGPRFRGEEPEPRPEVAPGHIPGSRNTPFYRLFRPDGTFKSSAELRGVLEDAGVDPSQPMVATCGSGVTACNFILATALLGNDQVRLYDGSWAEWGADPSTPKALGPA